MSKKYRVISSKDPKETVLRAGNISSGHGPGVNPVPNHNLSSAQFNNGKSWDQQRLF